MLHRSMVIKSTGREGKFENHVSIAALDGFKPVLFVYLQQSWKLL